MNGALVAPVAGSAPEDALLRSDRALGGLDDVAQRDRLGSPGELISALTPDGRAGDARPDERREDLRQVRVRYAHRPGDVASPLPARMAREIQDRTNRVVAAAAEDDLHDGRLAPQARFRWRRY